MINLLTAIALRENMVRLTFDVPIYFTNVLDPGDASDASRYSIVGIAESRGVDGLPPRAVFPAIAQLFSPTEIDLWVDRKLSPYPTRYTVAVNGLLEAFTLEGLVQYSVEFLGLRAGKPAPTLDNTISNADIANPQTLSGALDPLPNPGDDVLGTLPVDETGDIAHDEGIQSYRKRVFRRLGTKKGKMRGQPDYGVLAFASIKKLATPGLTQSIAADAEEQIGQEPETIAVQVRIVSIGEVAYYRIKARCTFGNFEELALVSVTG